MKFFPYENFYIITSLKPGEVQERLSEQTQPSSGFSLKSLFNNESGKEFSGYVVNGAFEIKRLIYYRNSFLPVITGATESHLNGSRVHIKMKLQTVVLIFMCIWLGGVGLFGLGFLAQNMSKGGFGPVMLVPIGMFIFGYLLATLGFKLALSMRV